MGELYNSKRKQKKITVFTAFMVVVFIAGALFDFNMTLGKTEKSRTVDFLTEWTKQNAEKMFMKLDEYYAVLEYASKLIKNKDLEDSDTWEFLEEEFISRNKDFQCVMLLNFSGRSVDTGEDYYSEPWFRSCISGNKGFGMKGDSYEEGIFLSVPVYDDEHVFRGAVCGLISVNDLDIFKKTWSFVKESNLYLIDKEGNYIIKQEEYKEADANFFEELESKELNLPLSTIQFRSRNGITVPLEINIDSRSGEIAVIAPVKKKGLCVVTVLSTRRAYRISRKYRTHVIFLTLKLISAFVVTAIVYLHFQREDRSYIRNLNQRLMMSEETYRITARNSDTCVFTYDVETGQIQFLNEKYKDLGLEQAEMSIPIFMKRMEEEHPEVSRSIEQILDSVDQKETSYMHKMTIRTGRQISYLKIRMTSIFDESGEVSRVVGSISDVTNNENNLRKLKKEEGFRNSLLSDSLGYMIVDVDRDCIVECTPAILKGRNPKDFSYTEVLGYFLSKNVRTDHWNEMKQKMSCQALKQLFEEKTDTKIYEYVVVDAQGEDIWSSCEIHLSRDAISNNLIAYMVYRNIDEIKRQQESLRRRATTDLLTGAWNRAAGTAQIEEIMRTLPDEGCVHAFAIADLDNFKRLNDVLGHMWGDKALFDVVKIMKKHCREEDVVCRLGGDEFVVFMRNIPRETVERNITALSRKLHITYKKEEKDVTISVSMGIVMARKQGSSFQELYEQADRCLYEVKRNKKGSYHISDEIKI